MKKIFTLVLLVASLVGISTVLSGCSSPEFQVVSQIVYSSGSDMDWAYGDHRKEFEVGKNCYMKLNMKIQTNKSSGEKVQIPVTVTIPKIKSVDANFLDGVGNISVVNDELNNVTIYNFNILAYKSEEPIIFEVVFQFVPNEESSIKVSVEYGDMINSAYNLTSSINFVKLEEDNTEEPEDDSNELL